MLLHCFKLYCRNRQQPFPLQLNFMFHHSTVGAIDCSVWMNTLADFFSVDTRLKSKLMGNWLVERCWILSCTCWRKIYWTHSDDHMEIGSKCRCGVLSSVYWDESSVGDDAQPDINEYFFHKVRFSSMVISFVSLNSMSNGMRSFFFAPTTSTSQRTGNHQLSYRVTNHFGLPTYDVFIEYKAAPITN